MMKPSKQSVKAAEAIWKKYERYLGAVNVANQDMTCCVQTIAEIISAHCDGAPEYLSEALNSGDGVYRP